MKSSDGLVIFTDRISPVIRIENKVGDWINFGESNKVTSIRTTRHPLVKTDYAQPVIQVSFNDIAPTYIGYFTNKVVRNHAFNIIGDCIIKANQMALPNIKIILPYDEFFKKSPNTYKVLDVYGIDGKEIMKDIWNYYDKDIRNIFKYMLFEMDYFKEVEIMGTLNKIFVKKDFTDITRETFAHSMSQIPSARYITKELIDEGIIPYTLWYYLYNEIKTNA